MRKDAREKGAAAKRGSSFVRRSSFIENPYKCSIRLYTGFAAGRPTWAPLQPVNDERLLFHSRLYFVFFAQHVVLVDVLRVQEGFGEVT